jgi:hypothetical protein
MPELLDVLVFSAVVVVGAGAVLLSRARSKTGAAENTQQQEPQETRLPGGDA